MKPYAVEVTWLDTVGAIGWQTEVRHDPCVVRSVGLVVEKTDSAIVLAGMVGEGIKPDVCPYGHTLTIPRACITKVRRLR